MVSLKGSRRAQAAMEFLMTYGWAILVVLIVIGALAYFGVLSPSTLLPEKCTFPVSLSCTDHSIVGGGSPYIALALQNGAGRDMTIRGIATTSEALGVGGMCCTAKTVAGVACAIAVTDTCLSVAAIGTSGCVGGSQFRNGETKTMTMGTPQAAGGCTYTDTGRDKNRYNITVYYSWADSATILHTLPGELLGRRP